MTKRLVKARNGEDVAAALKLVEAGLTDVEVGLRMGVDRHKVRYWRRKSGLPPKFLGARKKGGVTDDMVRASVLQGGRWRDIGRRVGMSASGVHQRAQSLGLKHHGVGGRPSPFLDVVAEPEPVVPFGRMLRVAGSPCGWYE